MDSRQTILTEFSEKSDELFRLGKQMHLSEDVINRCVKTALQKKLSLTRSPSLCGRIRRVVLLIVTLLIAMLLLFETPAWMEPTMAALSYQTTRVVRRMIVPFLSTDGADEYIPPTCLIPNPLYHVDETEDCDMCSDITHVVVLTGTPTYVRDKETNALAVFGVDVVADDTAQKHNEHGTYDFKNILIHRESTSPVNVDKILTVLSHHLNTMSDVIIDCSPDGQITVGDLIVNSQNSEVDFQAMSCTWKSRLNLLVASVMRKIFHRPKLIPKEAEIAQNKIIYLDGPGFGKRQIDGGFMDYQYAWYVQGQGERTLEFSPLLECETECEKVRVHIKEGETLVFPSKVWDVWLQTNTNSTSVSFEGHIYM